MSEERDPARFPFLAPELNKGQRQSTKSDIFLRVYAKADFPHFKRLLSSSTLQELFFR